MRELSLLSKHRSGIMLFSILWVIAFHFTPPLENEPNLGRSFLAMGYGGVDFFMFLSGFGLFSTYFNRSDFSILNFYKRRFQRIIPTYFLCIIAFGIIRKYSAVDILWDLTCVGFWIGKPYYDWYIQAALVLYAFFPLVLYLAKKIGVSKTMMIGCIIGLFLTSILVCLWKGSVILFTARIPVFFIGCYFGYCYNIHREIKHSRTLVVIGLLALLLELYLSYRLDPLFLFRSGLSTLPFMFVVPGMSLLLAKLMDYLPKFIYQPIHYFGSITLEIYLCHMSLRFIFPESKFVLPIVAGIVLHYIIKYSSNCFIAIKGNK